MNFTFPLREIDGEALATLAKQILIATPTMAPTEVSSITYTFHKNNGSFTFHVWFKNGDILDIPLQLTRASEFEDWLKHHGMELSEESPAVGFATGGIAQPSGRGNYHVGKGTLYVGPPRLPSDDEFVKLNFKSTPKATQPTTCPICYGTGFFKGFGGPCSSGCRPSR